MRPRRGPRTRQGAQRTRGRSETVRHVLDVPRRSESEDRRHPYRRKITVDAGRMGRCPCVSGVAARRASFCSARWTGVARVIGAPILPTEWQEARAELLRLGRLIERLHGFHRDVDVYRQAIKDLFPYGVDPERLLLDGDCQNVLEALNANLEKADLTAATELRQHLLQHSQSSRICHFIRVVLISAKIWEIPRFPRVRSSRHISKLLPRLSAFTA